MTIYKYAGFWRRLGAYTIDGTIIFFIFIVLIHNRRQLAFFFGAISGNNSDWLADLTDPTRFSSIMILIWIFLLSINIAYFTYFHGTTGRTPGKMLLRFAGSFCRRHTYFLRDRFFKIGRLFCLEYILPRLYLGCF